MGSIFTELVEIVKLAGVFKRNRKKKVLAALLYFLGLSLRMVSEGTVKIAGDMSRNKYF